MGKFRIVLTGIFISFLFCYLEWGDGKSGFIYEMEYDVLKKSFQGTNVFHPLVVLPFLGQLLLLYMIFGKRPYRKLSLIATGLLSLLVLVILLVGILAQNWKIILSTVPFLGFVFYFILKIKSH